jgi:phage-related protein
VSDRKVLTFVNRRVNMKLVRIARERWDVLAVVTPRDRCQVLDFLGGPEASQRVARRHLLFFLRFILPETGPPRDNADLCKSLGEGIFELRRQPKGPKLRVLFFYDDGRRIVCTNAFVKAERTPRSEIELARDLRKRYFEAKFHRELHIQEET